jgi:hypothetical protein
MQGIKPPRERNDERMTVQPVTFTTQTFSELELKNQKFRRIAWAAALLLLGVVTILILQLSEVIKY